MRWKLLLGIGAAALLLPVAAFALVKPARVLVPQAAGVSCPAAQVCVEEPARLEEALRLYQDAAERVQGQLGDFRSLPRVTYCGSEACYAWFGGSRDAGRTVSTFGIVIAPRGWKDYYVRHEMIHHWQAERMGRVAMWRMPVWAREGMAYELSGDPRDPLSEPIESYRREFREWNRQRGGRDLAAALREIR